MKTTEKIVNELILIREFDAPRDLVWKAWTDPKLFAKWWGPKNYTSPTCKMDVRVGGKYLWCMHSPEGQNYWTSGVYLKIVEPSLLVYTDSFADEKGNQVAASYYNMPGEWDLELEVTVRFDEHQGKTKMTLIHTGIPAGEMSDLTSVGWNESFDKLNECLKS